MGNLSKNFSDWEFYKSADGCMEKLFHDMKERGREPGQYISKILVEELQNLRDYLCELEGRDVKITIYSGMRTPEHSLHVDSTIDSFHNYGVAADIGAKGVDNSVLYNYFITVDAIRGVGHGRHKFHVDTRNREDQAEWEYH